MRVVRYLTGLAAKGPRICYLIGNHDELLRKFAGLHPATPRPKREDPAGRAVLRHYAPSTAQYGFHFQAYAPGISTPAIRR